MLCWTIIFFFCGSLWLEWSHIYAQCHWRWMRGGIRSSWTYLILLGELMGLITLRLCEFRFMLTAVLEGYALLTVFTQTKSSLRSSSSISLCRFESQSLLTTIVFLHDSLYFTYNLFVQLQKAWKVIPSVYFLSDRPRASTLGESFRMACSIHGMWNLPYLEQLVTW